MRRSHRSGGLWRGITLGIAVSAAALVAAPVAAGADTTWTVASAPSVTPPEGLYGVACADASHCWAVGQNSTDGYTLIEGWDGTSWSVDSTDTHAGELNAVSCVSDTDCWAVGWTEVDLIVPLFAQLSGSSWSFTVGSGTGQYDPSGDNYLNAVSCPSASLCWAVGNVAPTSGSDTTLYEEYSGGSWSEDTADSGADGADATLYGLSCADATHCQAVGTDDSGQPFTSGWTSSPGWSSTASGEGSLDLSSLSGASGGDLEGVSCVSDNDCWAVGDWGGSPEQALFASWGGSGWTVDTTASAAGGSADNSGGTDDNYLYGVSCTSADTCTAAGEYYATADQTLIDSYGASWSLVSGTPNSGSDVQNDLHAVACVSGLCVAVGSWYPSEDSQTPLILMYSAPASVPVPASGGGWSGPGVGSVVGAGLLGAGLLVVLLGAMPAVRRRRLVRR
jgi:hypothetical protein